MNNINAITDSLLLQVDNVKHVGQSDPVMKKQEVEAAKSFEALLIGKLVETMQETVGQWGYEKDSAFGQVQGIFSHYLSESISEQGGLGLWKDMCNLFEQAESAIDQNNFDRTI